MWPSSNTTHQHRNLTDNFLAQDGGLFTGCFRSEQILTSLSRRWQLFTWCYKALPTWVSVFLICQRYQVRSVPTHQARSPSRPWSHWGLRPTPQRSTSGRGGSCSGRRFGSCRLRPEFLSVWPSWRSSFRILRIWTSLGREGGRCWRGPALTLQEQTTTSEYHELLSPVSALGLSWPLALHVVKSETQNISLSGHLAGHL